MPTSLDCSLCPPPTPSLQVPQLIGQSAEMQCLRSQLHHLGPHFRIVLLRGERGTGKELVARTLHRLSSHAAGPFMIYKSVVNAKEHERLAATGETFESMAKLAHRGTLYLDQIDQMAPESQSALLEFLRSKERKTGAHIVVHGLEARIVASTTIDLEGLVVSGRFNRALFERLVAVEIDIPPLRERVADIPLLAEQFKLKCSRCLGCPVTSISPLALTEMQAYRWPGNVQELRIAIRRAVIESQGGVIEPHHLALPKNEVPPRGLELHSAPPKLQEVMEQYVFTVLNGCGGNKARAAEVLGISRSTLYRMLDSAQEKVENPEFDLSAA